LRGSRKGPGKSGEPGAFQEKFIVQTLTTGGAMLIAQRVLLDQTLAKRPCLGGGEKTVELETFSLKKGLSREKGGKGKIHFKEMLAKSR